MLETITSVIMIMIFFTIAIMIRLKKIPPISMVYMTSQLATKTKLKNDVEEIRFVSNAFFLAAALFVFVFFLTIFPEIRILEFSAYAFAALLIAYVLYKSIYSEIKSGKK